jgi:hypothetical protein
VSPSPVSSSVSSPPRRSPHSRRGRSGPATHHRRGDRPRATETSHRLAELRAREGAARAPVDGRPPGGRRSLPSSATRARTTWTSSASARRTAHSACSTPTCPTTTAAASTCSGRSTRAGGSRRSSAPRGRGGATGATSRPRAPTCARDDPQLLGPGHRARRCASSSSALARVEAQLRDVRSRFEAGFVPPNDVLRSRPSGRGSRCCSSRPATRPRVAEADLARLVGLPTAARSSSLRRSTTPWGSRCTPSTRRSTDAGARGPNAPRSSRASARRSSGRRRPRPAAVPRWPSSAASTTRARTRASFRAKTRGTSRGTSAWRSRGRSGTAAACGPSAPKRRSSPLPRARASRSSTRCSRLEVRQRRARSRIRPRADRRGRRRRAAAAEARAGRARAVRGRRGDQTELLDAEVALLQADLDRTRALAGARLARARLDRATGR